ncbi:MAG: MATE family efflux transporter [Candidatus Hydrogenedens sp.]|nr:MATE family efflux transporter [Candidatus Hydrogenedens sp.]
MNSPTSEKVEDRFAGVREVMGMALPIAMGTMSFVAMDFADKFMVAQLGTGQLAAIGSAGIWSYLAAAIIIGIVGCISTFVGQSIGRGEGENAGAYTWQGFYISLLAGGLALIMWPLAAPLFGLMGHSPQTTQLETTYFQIRLLGYFPLAWGTALATFFQGVNRPFVQMYVMIAGNFLNIFFNYLLIFGHWGAPAMGMAGAAWGTVLSQFAQAGALHLIFYLPAFDRAYATRSTWRFDARRFRELIRIGAPSGIHMLLDVATWGVFISFVIGRFGDAQLAANNAAISFMHVSFMPALALNQAIAPIVGQWIGRGNFALAKARTYTAIKIAMIYMTGMGLVFAFIGDQMIATFFTDDPAIIRLGWQLLVCAAVFQGFDGMNIVCAGALRGAGDTKWVMYATLVAAYPIFLPIATLMAWLGGGALGAWIGATFYITGLSFTLLWRFRAERWRSISIFDASAPPLATMTPAEQVAK